MTTGTRLTEFGKRQPARQPDTPPPKRSSHVALLVMGTLAVGGGAYALMGPENCQPASPGMAGPAVPQTTTACTSRGWSGGSSGYTRSSHYSFFGGDSSSHGSSSGTMESGGVSRGGFGSFAHAFGFGGS